jgi:hypothetical protein
MKKLSQIQMAQATLLMGYFREFKPWPQSLSEMLNQWDIGFDRKSRKRDMTAILNYLADIGKIKFETIVKPNGCNEIGFRIVRGA